MTTVRIKIKIYCKLCQRSGMKILDFPVGRELFVGCILCKSWKFSKMVFSPTGKSAFYWPKFSVEIEPV